MVKRIRDFQIGGLFRRRSFHLCLIAAVLGLSQSEAGKAEVPLPEQQPGTVLPQDDGKTAPAQKQVAPLPEDNLPDDVQACYENNDPQLRVVACTHAIEGRQATGDQLAAVYYNRAIGYTLMGKTDFAIRDFTQAIKLRPDTPPAYINRGIAHMRRANPTSQDLTAAKQDFDAAIAKDKDNVDGHYLRAWVESQQGKDADAVADLDNVLKNHPDHFDALLDRGGLLLRNGKFDPAIADFTAMIKLDAKAAAAFYNRGRAYFAKGDYTAAATDFASAMNLRDGNPYAALRLNLARQFQAQAAKKDPQAGGDAKALEAAAGKLLDQQWPVQVIRYFQGKMDQAAIFAALDSSDLKQGQGFRCEFNYYLGQQALLKGDRKAAADFFKAALATKSSTTIEYIDSNLALKQLGG
ncbi:MAG TPA: tetratricopeptide repeat protein [Dongiaceae bacterium]|nr:tetratricopeptide repeat protein [Dongiaceae bacterium]